MMKSEDLYYDVEILHIKYVNNHETYKVTEEEMR